MINYFKTIINNPIIIYDEFFNVIVSTDDYLHEYEKIPGSDEKNFLKNLYYYKQNIVFKNANMPNKEYVRVLFPITFEKRDKAFLAVFEINSQLTCIDYTILEICATSTLIEMKRLMAIKKIEEKHLNDFLYDLIYRTDNKIDEIKRRAEILNINQDSYYCSIIFDIHFKDTNKTSKDNTFEELKDIIFNNITSFISKSNKQALVSRFGKSILILYKVNSNSNESYIEINEMCSSLQNFLIKKHEYIYIHVGIGSIINNLVSVTKSYHEALSSVSFGRTICGETLGFIISYNDSSLLKIFSKVKDNDLINEIVPENLKKLKIYDKENNSDLIKTLSVYLDCNCNAKKASEKMFIHYKTMLYRLDKIIKDFSIDLENSNSRLQIELGLQVINILDLKSHSELQLF
jgi:purine catabolism regulator